ncbi:MAG: hypothetical protein C4326_00310 [Ignavibacteria bacterium]
MNNKEQSYKVMDSTTNDIAEYLASHHFITPVQRERIARLCSNEVFSLRDELKWTLWAGIMLLIGGIVAYGGHTINTTGQRVLIALLFILAGAAFVSAKPSSNAQLTHLPSAQIANAVVTLGGFVLGFALGYWQYAYAPFGSAWEMIGVVVALVCVPIAYWYNLTGALAVGLVGMGIAIAVAVAPLTWIMQGFIPRGDLISVGIAYGGLLVVVGAGLQYFNIYRHFTTTYMHTAAHFMYIAALAGLMTEEEKVLFFLILALLTSAGVWYARKTRAFSVLLTTLVYCYLGIAFVVSSVITEPTLQTIYIILTCAAVMVALFSFRKSFKEA